MKRLWWIIYACVVAFGVIVVIVLLVAPKSPIPNSIKKKLTSTLMVPPGRVGQVNRDSVKYDSKLKLLSFKSDFSGSTILISEQPTPESFTDIPQVYDKVIDGMQEYAKFEDDLGTVHLTRPKDQGGGQVAVLNTKGTLLFAKPDKDLTTDQWKQYFLAMDVIK